MNHPISSTGQDRRLERVYPIPGTDVTAKAYGEDVILSRPTTSLEMQHIFPIAPPREEMICLGQPVADAWLMCDGTRSLAGILAAVAAGAKGATRERAASLVAAAFLRLGTGGWLILQERADD